jgi:hypothetical protein
LALPWSICSWTLTTLREKLVKIGAKLVTRATYFVFQLTEVGRFPSPSARLLACPSATVSPHGRSD